MSVTKTSLTHQKVKYFFSYSSYLGKTFFLYSWLVQLLKTNEISPILSGVSIIADVAESIAETEPISINRIDIWDRLIGKKR